ncbi:glycosyltransferase family A protein [Methanolobus sp. ZRKC2]|uniref:glycosyltransferase family 2 protein n=1 Tax=Methanolobus sp. ZRKC2 TaxID=3125783 RepID=UPI00324CB599
MYLIITPCKNEIDNLPKLVESVMKQTIRPIMWVIVDDGSSDGSKNIEKEAASKNSWIHILEINEEHKRDLGPHLSQNIKRGFEYAVDFLKENDLDYKFIGNLDADLSIPSSFFEELVDEFNLDDTLGIASSGIKLTKNGQLVHVTGLPEDEPSGGNMLMRRECYEDCGSIPVSYSWDSVLKAKARFKGWKTKRFEKIIAVESRDVSNAEGYWNGYIVYGQSSYYLGFHPLHIILKSCIYISKKPYYIGFAYLVGYFYDFFLRKEQIADDELKQYFKRKWVIAIKKYLPRR